MELELELKLTRVADEFSSADFLLAKDRAGPLFISTESDTMFILTAHLKGYKKQDIEIEINEDGTRIIIKGEKLVQETVMLGWKLQKKETEKREFRKAFKIPDGVILDKIKARFDDDECKLTISMPKKEKGIRGVSIQEVNEPEIDRQGSETLQIVPDKFPEEQDLQPEKLKGKEEESVQEENSTQVPETIGAQETVETGSDVVNPQETQMSDQNDQNGSPQKESSGHDHVESDTIKEMKNIANEIREEAKTPILVDQEAIKESSKFETGMQGETSQSNEEKLQGEHDQCPPLEQEINKNQLNEHQVNEDNVEEDDKEDESAYGRHTDEAQLQEAFVVHYIRTKNQPGKRRD
ncbi:OLC1v1017701C1 [Oldenlandia corymbosa var. corymbosa]|uniref:OLC1v1017701C1 n=1 Tax=Oldenlandia corymbosa var. corymbosa TaxID=529605 RepID=A0AAV1EA41_OLDCO|nr:OLC1v1017701C1 [Oldenlandia corymbosa var. corymbosa]